MNDEEKIKWILQNWGKAKARAKNLEVKAKNLQYSLEAKPLVGGRGSGDGPSEQEKHVISKDEIEFDARALMWNIEAIEESVESLPEQQRQAIRGKYLDGLSLTIIGERMSPTKAKTTVFSMKEKGIYNLSNRGILHCYEALRTLLDE